jgi:hypothetical protein
LSDKWKEELQKMKTDREKKVENEVRIGEELKEKYKEDIKKIIDMIKAQCEPVVETFRNLSEQEANQPKLNEGVSWVTMSFPLIVYSSGYATLNLGFSLVLTEKGYNIGVRLEFYNDADSRTYSTSRQIQATEDAVREQIREFLESIERARKRIEETNRIQRRRFS